jgi:hypothetical protein
MDKSKKSKTTNSSKKAWDEKDASTQDQSQPVENVTTEKEREKDREKDRDRERDRDREKTREKDKEKDSEKDSENENESDGESDKNTDTDNKSESGSEGEGDDDDDDSDFEYVEVDKIIQLLQLAFFHPDTGLNLCQTFTRVADSIDKNTKTVAKLLQHYESKEQRRKSKS